MWLEGAGWCASHCEWALSSCLGLKLVIDNSNLYLRSHLIFELNGLCHPTVESFSDRTMVKGYSNRMLWPMSSTILQCHNERDCFKVLKDFLN